MNLWVGTVEYVQCGSRVALLDLPFGLVEQRIGGMRRVHRVASQAEGQTSPVLEPAPRLGLVSDCSTTPSDPYNLERFLEAQDGTYERAAQEVRAGRKASHWMWFVFPQIAGLGFSDTSRYYAISGLDEARAYLRHPILGPRLEAISRILVEDLPRSDPQLTALQIFGHTDATKLRSSMTLFALAAAPPLGVFRQVLDVYFDGREDERTSALAGA